MPTTLVYNNIERTECDTSIINTLLRKGWLAVPVQPKMPEYNKDTEKIEYNKDTNSWIVSLLSQEEIEQMQESQKMMVKSIKKQQITDIINQGFLVNPENFTLNLHDEDRNIFTQMLSLVKEALDLGLITNETPQTIADKNGQKHEISTLRFREIMVQYGFYYKSLWDQMT